MADKITLSTATEETMVFITKAFELLNERNSASKTDFPMELVVSVAKKISDNYNARIQTGGMSDLDLRIKQLIAVLEDNLTG